ncbi:MAG TPA: hypothetical protein VFW86_05730 [Candidatus Limnocylindrales bacterium]|nr:hypothetical protein [Candidatus Limnocylindrales bacterium]
MTELLSEIGLRALKVLAAIILGAVFFWVATSLGEPGSAVLALAAFGAAGIVVLLLESSPL